LGRNVDKQKSSRASTQGTQRAFRDQRSSSSSGKSDPSYQHVRGICVSLSAYEQVRGKVGVEFTDLGEQTLRNIARPIRAYAVGLSASAHQPAPLPTSAPRLSIVVLPFANLSGDPDQEYFVDGVTESLTTDLSRIAGAFVIARNTRVHLQGQTR
jgi:hypothetical protein